MAKCCPSPTDLSLDPQAFATPSRRLLLPNLTKAHRMIMTFLDTKVGSWPLVVFQLLTILIERMLDSKGHNLYHAKIIIDHTYDT